MTTMTWKITLPSHIGASILSNSKRIMINFKRAINGFYKNNINYGDTDIWYIETNIGMCCIKKI